MRSLLLILWFATWPVSHLFGTPAEAEGTVSWQLVVVILFLALALIGLVTLGAP